MSYLFKIYFLIYSVAFFFFFVKLVVSVYLPLFHCFFDILDGTLGVVVGAFEHSELGEVLLAKKLLVGFDLFAVFSIKLRQSLR